MSISSAPSAVPTVRTRSRSAPETRRPPQSLDLAARDPASAAQGATDRTDVPHLRRQLELAPLQAQFLSRSTGRECLRDFHNRHLRAPP